MLDYMEFGRGFPRQSNQRMRLFYLACPPERICQTPSGEYLNYAREHWMHENENPPVGLILYVQKDEAAARRAFAELSNKAMAAEYRTALPDAVFVHIACRVFPVSSMKAMCPGNWRSKQFGHA